MAEKPMRTRCYYTDYVNHMIRFYLSTPDQIDLKDKRQADVNNWLAVQEIFRRMRDDDRRVLTTVFKKHHRVSEGVRMYCEETGADSYRTWVIITKTSQAIAKRRGLI